MNFYTISTFRDVIASLLKKPREGYSSVIIAGVRVNDAEDGGS